MKCWSTSVGNLLTLVPNFWKIRVWKRSLIEFCKIQRSRLWKTESEHIITNYNKIERRGIACVLHSYKAHPIIILSVCKSILENWKTEIIQPIFQVYGEIHHGDHIKISLGHPDLKPLAKKIAEEIKEAEVSKAMKIPDYLIKIVHTILKDNIFPEWNLKREDESNTH